MKHRFLAVVAAVMMVFAFLTVSATPANAGWQERVCNRSDSTLLTYLKVRIGLSTPARWQYVGKGYCSDGYATYFYAPEGDCYSYWGTRYDEDVVYRYFGTGSMYLRCYIT